MLKFFGLFGSHRPASACAVSARRGPAKPSGPHYFRPCLEEFEDRVVPAAPVLGPGLVAPAAIVPNIAVTGVQLTNLQVVNNVLHAAGTVSGTLAGLPFIANITDLALQLVPDNSVTPAIECSVLHLELAPIHLTLLGLHVDTSAICLDITAIENGGLLGDLLCDLAGGGLLGTGIPTLPTAGQLSTLQNGLANILNGALTSQLAQPAAADHSVCTGQCDVLELSLGPIDLTLLGLNVSLDDCADGPVQVCVSATRSEGLLGSLLCGLSSNRLLRLTLEDINQLVSTATGFLADGRLSPIEAGQLRSLLARLIS